MQIISKSTLNGYDVFKVEHNGDILERWGDSIKYDWSILTRNIYGVMVTEVEKEFQKEYKKYLRNKKLERIVNGI